MAPVFRHKVDLPGVFTFSPSSVSGGHWQPHSCEKQGDIRVSIIKIGRFWQLFRGVFCYSGVGHRVPLSIGANRHI